MSSLLPVYPRDLTIVSGKGATLVDASGRSYLDCAAGVAVNGLGYGDGVSGLELDLVYNPLGPSLPPAQAELEATYRDELARLYPDVQQQEARWDAVEEVVNAAAGYSNKAKSPSLAGFLNDLFGVDETMCVLDEEGGHDCRALFQCDTHGIFVDRR